VFVVIAKNEKREAKEDKEGIRRTEFNFHPSKKDVK